MALTELDREDLFRDGRAMPIRGDIEVDSILWLFGFRRQGQASLYAGPDCVIQFNLRGELRRLYHGGHRMAAEQGKLYRLDTLNRGQQLHLQRVAVSHEEQRHFLELVAEQLRILDGLTHSLDHWRTHGLEPDEFAMRVADWISASALPLRLAELPNVSPDA